MRASTPGKPRSTNCLDSCLRSQYFQTGWFLWATYPQRSAKNKYEELNKCLDHVAGKVNVNKSWLKPLKMCWSNWYRNSGEIKWVFFQCLKSFLGAHFQDEDQESYNSMSSLLIYRRHSLSGSRKNWNGNLPSVNQEFGISVVSTSPCIQQPSLKKCIEGGNISAIQVFFRYIT